VRWPWNRRFSNNQLVVSWADGVLSYVLARPNAAGGFDIKAAGVEHRGDDGWEAFAERLTALGLKDVAGIGMLRPEQYQVFQIDAPKVPPEEMRAAARYLVKDMVSAHIDDVTLDVLKVGDGQHKAHDQMFVVVATNARVREMLDLSDRMKWGIRTIDIQETAQRNLQSALARKEQRGERADALLALADDRQGVLTISANDELFFTRRLELPPGFTTMAWMAEGSTVGAPVQQGFVPVSEYVPDYAVQGASYGADYSAGTVDYGAAGQEPHQRVLVELQRSLDLWDRTWTALPLHSVRVAAGGRSGEMAQWLVRDLGQAVQAMDTASFFTGWSALPEGDRMACWPLLGVLLRTEPRAL
jgi:MSHA biogenesis protein MshI